jgi:hypothetical protein
MDYQVSFSICRFPVYHNTDMGYATTQVPANQVTGHIISRIGGYWLYLTTQSWENLLK